MVKIIKKTKEEKDLEEKAEKIFNFTKSLLKIKYIFKAPTMNIISIVHGKISVIPDSNRVMVTDREYFNMAKNLALNYEGFTKEEWSLKEEYD